MSANGERTFTGEVFTNWAAKLATKTRLVIENMFVAGRLPRHKPRNAEAMEE